MTKESKHEASIHGNVEKLTQIGTLNGNVIIVSDKAIKKVLPYSIHSSIAEDVTDYIKVVVKSNRFGRKVQVRVPHDITVSAFIDLVVDVLGLPWSHQIDELMISFDFSYAVVFGEERLSLNTTLRKAGISDGEEVQLSISALWTDEIEKAEQEEMGPVMYEMGSRMQTLARRAAAREARGSLTRSKIKSLADSSFTFVDEMGK